MRRSQGHQLRLVSDADDAGLGSRRVSVSTRAGHVEGSGKVIVLIEQAQCPGLFALESVLARVVASPPYMQDQHGTCDGS